MPISQARQFTYILRVWREDATAPWRASVQNAATGDRTYFALMEDVCGFLRTLTGTTSSSSASLTSDDTSLPV